MEEHTYTVKMPVNHIYEPVGPGFEKLSRHVADRVMKVYKSVKGLHVSVVCVCDQTHEVVDRVVVDEEE